MPTTSPPTIETGAPTISERKLLPLPVLGALLLQTSWAAVIIGLSIYLLILARGRPHEHAIGLRVAAAVIAIPGLIVATSSYGLWKFKRWGWWLSQICDWGIVAVLAYAVIDDLRDGTDDFGLIIANLIAFVVPVYLLIPRVRRLCLGNTAR